MQGCLYDNSKHSRFDQTRLIIVNSTVSQSITLGKLQCLYPTNPKLYDLEMCMNHVGHEYIGTEMYIEYSGSVS